jgi:hypothetical protein
MEKENLMDCSVNAESHIGDLDVCPMIFGEEEFE